MIMRRVKKRHLLYVGVASFVCAIVACMHVAIDRTVDYAVGVNAARTAVSWSGYLVKRLPDLPDLIAEGRPDPKQAVEIASIAEVGDVFRFKLFNASGRLVLISDSIAETFEPGALHDHNGNAAKVVRTGKYQISLRDGRQKTNRPDLYVEAYVPVIGPQGTLLGVAEVYLDQTAVSTLFHTLFNTLALGLTALLLLAFVVPYRSFLTSARLERRSRARASFLARHDPVSNVLNRFGLLEMIRLEEDETRLSLANASVIFLDIDHFKAINDSFGHKVGDAFLAHVGDCITRCLASRDLVGRMGGDEFMIIAERRKLEDVHALVEKIQSLVSSPLRCDGATVVGHLSIGIHFPDGEGIPIEGRMHKADVALYQAKMDGRNVYRTFTVDMEAQTLRRRQIEASVLSGLEQDRFELQYQPLLHQTTRSCAGFEALLRFRDESGTPVPPAEFIPVAEAIGAIGRIGAWVLDRAIETAADWPDHLFVAVNLSARQFQDNSLIPHIRAALDRTGLDPARLELEVTESLIMEDSESVAAQLHELRALGVSLAMDDFGTGYSSLGYLWQFGFNKLKIDRSFIAGLENESRKPVEIIDTIIMLGHKLDMTVTAEGIETERQAKYLADLECDHFQGYLYGRPMNREDLAPYLLNTLSLPFVGDDELERKPA